MGQLKSKLGASGSSRSQTEKPLGTYSSAVSLAIASWNGNGIYFRLFLLQYAFIYIFNLVIGVGALALPKAFSDAGIILGTVLLIVLAFISYMTATFMVEAMAAANAYVRHKKRQSHSVVEAQSNGIQSSSGKNDTDYVSKALSFV